MLSENLLYDPNFNLLSIPAQNLFVRMLIKTDDYGILPADRWPMLNLPVSIERKLEQLIGEMETVGLIVGILYEDRPFLVFKRDRFDEYQSYLIKNRTHSEYLRLSRDAMEGNVFQEILGKPWKFQRVGMPTNRKIKDKEDLQESCHKLTERALFQNEKLVVPEELREKFAAEFGRGLLDREIPAMERWLRVNKPKKDYNRFVWNWLNRARMNLPAQSVMIPKKPNFCPIHRLEYTEKQCPKCFIPLGDNQ
jgi:hypothetical protein